MRSAYGDIQRLTGNRDSSIICCEAGKAILKNGSMCHRIHAEPAWFPRRKIGHFKGSRFLFPNHSGSLRFAPESRPYSRCAVAPAVPDTSGQPPREGYFKIRFGPPGVGPPRLPRPARPSSMACMKRSDPGSLVDDGPEKQYLPQI